MYSGIISFFFFFQAEDGIRDLTVTGVQTCALPISIQVWHWVWVCTVPSCVALENLRNCCTMKFHDTYFDSATTLRCHTFLQKQNPYQQNTVRWRDTAIPTIAALFPP